jgi:hypothetical protein
MKFKIASNINWKQVLIAAVLLTIFTATIGTHIYAEGLKYDSSSSDTQIGDVPLTLTVGGTDIYNLEYLTSETVGPEEEVTVETNYLSMFMNEYASDVTLLCKTFGLKEEDVIKSLEKLYEENPDEFEKTNVGYLRDKNGKIRVYDTAHYGLYMYLQNYTDEHPESVSKKTIQYTGNSKYVEMLIIYYTKNIFTNVDTDLALSIGAAESGYYTAKYMLRCNNVYGGMGSNGLIKYRSIEQGVYRYIRYLSNNYISKGLTTLPSIGRVYCPTTDVTGNRIASPHWIQLVTRALNHYNGSNYNITASDVLASK